MNTQGLTDELNQLLAGEARGLLRHLDEAKPYLTPKTYAVWRTVQHMAHDTADHADRLTDLLESAGLPARAPSFESEVASYHYMTVESLLPLLIEEKRRQVEAYDRAIGHAGPGAAIAPELAALRDDNVQQLHQLETLVSAAVV